MPILPFELPACLPVRTLHALAQRRRGIPAGEWEEAWAGGLVQPDRGRPLLFLDIDGVMHANASTASERWSRWPLIEAVLDAVQHVDVVWSSSWRYEVPWEGLMAFVPPTLSGRFIGATPAHLYASGSGCPPGTRRLEIEAFLQRLNAVNRPWLALDDQPLFEGSSVALTNVLYCNPRTGFLPGQTGGGFADQKLLQAGLERLVVSSQVVVR